MKRKYYKIIFVIVLISIIFIGCHKETELVSEPVEIAIGYWDSSVFFEDDNLTDFIEQKFNIKIKPVPINYYFWENDYKEMILSGTAPDLFVSDYLANSNYQYLVKNNYIMEITRELSNYPNLSKYMDNPYFDYFKTEGTIYCIPRLGYENEALWGLNRVILVRRDWMIDGGYSMPKNFEEFEKLLDYFKNGDPDKNGIDDTIGFQVENVNKIEGLYLGLAPYFSNIERGWIEQDSKWMPIWYSNEAAKVFEYFDRLYEEGLLFEDFAFVNSLQCATDFIEGKVGCIAYPYFQLLKLFPNEQQFFEDSVEIMHPWLIDNNDKSYRFTTTNHWSELYISNTIEETKKEKIFSLLDYLLSKDFDTDISANSFNLEKSFQFYFELVKYDITKYFKNGYIPISDKLETYIDSQVDWVINNTMPVDYDWNAVLLNTEFKNQLPSNIEIHNAIIRAILSKKPIEEAWAKEIESIELNYPLSQAINEVTNYMDNMH